MLIGPKTAPPHRGDDVSLTLEFDDGTRLPVSAAVRDDAAGHGRGQGPHRGYHHGH
jgi:copper(I)-binding protein